MARVRKSPAARGAKGLAALARGAAKAGAKAAARAAKQAGKGTWILRGLPKDLNLNAFSPGLTVRDLARTIEFYTEGLGFRIKERWEREGELHGVRLVAGSCELAVVQDDWALGKRRKKGQGVRIWCETDHDVDLLAERAAAHGATITDPPEDKAWGVRSVSLDDPDGYHLTFFRRATA